MGAMTLRVPFSAATAAEIRKEAKQKGMSQSGYINELVTKALESSELSSLLNYSLSYEEYIQIYLPKEIYEKAKNLSIGIEMSKICYFLAMKGRFIK